MNLKQKIIEDKITFFKNRDKHKVLILSTLIGEADRKDKDIKDEDMLKIISKTIQGCIECGNLQEANFLETYLPKQLSEEELINIINEFCTKENITEKKYIGKIMVFLKAEYGGMYNGKIANEIVSKILN